MSEQTIEVQADSLEEAKEKIRAQIPEGLQLLSEEVISNGKPKIIKCTSDTLEAAFETARSKIPVGADVVGRKELSAPEKKVITVEADDEQTARVQAERQIGSTERVEGITLIELGKKGLLGIGKKPNRYEIQVFRQAIVEVTYREKVKIRATIGEKTLSKVSFPTKNLRAIILYMQNVSAPPGGGDFAFDVFLSLNNPNLRKLQSSGVNPVIQAQNLKIDDFQNFISKATALASDEMRNRFGSCCLVIQPNTVLVPGTGKRNVALCSFFASPQAAVVLLEPQQPYKLE